MVINAGTLIRARTAPSGPASFELGLGCFSTATFSEDRCGIGAYPIGFSQNARLCHARPVRMDRYRRGDAMRIAHATIPVHPIVNRRAKRGSISYELCDSAVHHDAAPLLSGILLTSQGCPSLGVITTWWWWW